MYIDPDGHEELSVVDAVKIMRYLYVMGYNVEYDPITGEYTSEIKKIIEPVLKELLELGSTSTNVSDFLKNTSDIRKSSFCPEFNRIVSAMLNNGYVSDNDYNKIMELIFTTGQTISLEYGATNNIGASGEISLSKKNSKIQSVDSEKNLATILTYAGITIFVYWACSNEFNRCDFDRIDWYISRIFGSSFDVEPL